VFPELVVPSSGLWRLIVENVFFESSNQRKREEFIRKIVFNGFEMSRGDPIKLFGEVIYTEV
jgi:hypothetical protein